MNKLPRYIEQLQELVDEQAEDEGLWAVPAEGTQRISEAYLQQQLRKLHAKVESTLPRILEEYAAIKEALEFYAAYDDDETMWDRRGVSKARQVLEKYEMGKCDNRSSAYRAFDFRVV